VNLVLFHAAVGLFVHRRELRDVLWVWGGMCLALCFMFWGIFSVNQQVEDHSGGSPLWIIFWMSFILYIKPPYPLSFPLPYPLFLPILISIPVQWQHAA